MAMSNELLRTLVTLEEERQASISKARFWAAPILLLAGFAALVIHGHHSTGGTIMALVVGIILAAIAYNYLISKVVKRFKQQIMPILLEDIDPSLSYYFDGSIDLDEFNQPGMFTQPDRFSGKDVVQGTIGQTAIKFSLVDAEEERQHTSTDSDGRTSTTTTYVTIFKGLFFIADFNKNFAGRTLVKPHSWNIFDKLFGSTLTLEDPEFNKLFTVQSTDLVEGRYIMTPSLMDKFKLLHDKVGDFQACFIQGRLFMAINLPQNFFEPAMNESLADSQQIKKIMTNLKMITGLVEDLGLNVRIWGTKTNS